MLLYTDSQLHMQSISLATVPLIVTEMNRQKQSVSYRFLYFRAGTCEITFDGRTHILRSGDLCFLLPGTQYITKPLSPNQVANFFFTVNGSDNALPFSDYPLLNRPFVVSSPEAAELFEQIIEENIFAKPLYKQEKT